MSATPHWFGACWIHIWWLQQNRYWREILELTVLTGKKKKKIQNVTFDWVVCSVYSNSAGLGPERVSAMLLKTSGELFTGVEVSPASLCWILLLLFGVLNKELADSWWTIAQSGKPFTSGFLHTSGVFFAAGAFLQILLLGFNEPPKRQFSVKRLEWLILVLKLNVETVTWETWTAGTFHCGVTCSSLKLSRLHLLNQDLNQKYDFSCTATWGKIALK